MSLQIWLPLNDDLTNLGLDGTKVPSLMGTGITYTKGKIGKAATFPNNCNSCIYMDGLKLQIFSWAVWFKVLGEGSGTSQRFISEGRDTGSIGTNLWVSKAGTTLSWSTHKKSGNIAISLNTWYHVVLTADGSNIKFYLNGELKSTTAYTEDSDYAQSNDKFVLGKMAYSYSNTGNYFPFNGQLNDVRVYDHALSAKEVEELARGLVLHYKLDNNGFGNKNLFTNTGFYKTATQSQAAAASSPSVSFTENLQNLVGKTITFSFELYTPGARQNGPNGGSLNGRFGAHLSLNYTPSGRSAVQAYPCADNLTTTITKKGYRVAMTYTVPSNCTINNFSMDIQTYAQPASGNTETWFFGYPKVEYGNKATPWSPAPEDYEDQNIIYDTSGYKRNGTIIGELTTSSSSPRYNACTYFNGSSDIRSAKGSFEWFDFKEGTVAAWYNPANTTQTWASVGIQNDSGQGSRSFSVCNYSGKAATVVGYDSSWGNSSSNFSMAANTWYHLCATITNGDTIKLYVNGELIQTRTVTNSTGTVASTTQFAVGVDLPGSDERFTGYLSDIRCYSTALTAKQVKELYDTSATIDNNGNVYVREVVEI